MNKKSPTIFILKYRALGDSIMGLSTISYLRSIYPNSKIYYGVRGWTAGLYERVETDADGIIPVRFDSFSDYFKMWKLFKLLKVDHIHEMHLSGRTKKFCSIYSKLTGTKYTYHNHHLDSKGMEVFDQGVLKPLIQRDIDGAFTFLGNSKVPPSYLDFEPRFKNFSVEKNHSLIFGVVATRETKMWKLESYVLLADAIKREFPGYKIRVPLSPSEQDKQILERLKSLDKNKNLEFIIEPLAKLPAIIGASDLYIGNDTGLKHLAIACGVKSYTFFGPEPPNEWHPYNKEKHPYFYIEDLECRTREAHYCGLNQCDSMICLNDIQAIDVFNTIKKDLRNV